MGGNAGKGASSLGSHESLIRFLPLALARALRTQGSLWVARVAQAGVSRWVQVGACQDGGRGLAFPEVWETSHHYQSGWRIRCSTLAES